MSDRFKAALQRIVLMTHKRLMVADAKTPEEFIKDNNLVAEDLLWISEKAGEIALVALNESDADVAQG